jgi:proliferating cell nuclear antigen
MTDLEGTIRNGDLKTILNAVTVLVDEARVFLENDEVIIRGTDPAGVCIVQITISEDALENPEIRQASMCLDFTELTDMVNTADADADVHIQVHEHDMEIDVLDLDFSLTLIDSEALDSDQAIPNLDLPAEVVISSSAFKRGIKAGNLVAEHIEFGINETDPAFYMRAKGDSNEVVMEKREEDLGALTAGSVSSTYSLDYLTEIRGSIPTDTNIGINLGDDHPVEISFDLVDGNATVTYFLAPRLEPDS